MIRVDVHTDSELPPVETTRLQEAIAVVLQRHGVQQASISLAIIGDDEMHALNRQHLQHDYPTDVLSFVYASEPSLEGEIIVSLDTAAREAQRYQWQTADELLLYVVHGMLHLVGYDDHDASDLERMRAEETATLLHFDLKPHYDAPGPAVAARDVVERGSE